MLNSRMNSTNKAICYAEVINMHSLRELFNNSTPVHNTTHRNDPSTQNVLVERSELVRK